MGGWARSVCDREHAHLEPPPAVVLEADLAVGEGEEGVVLAEADVLARLPLGAVLANDDRPAGHPLAAEPLHAEPLGVAVPPVPARALAFLVRHYGNLMKTGTAPDGPLGNAPCVGPV